MIERFLHQVRVELPAAQETTADARTRLAARFPRTALRRMTHLGLLAGSVLDGTALEPEDAVVLATTFAETRALEDFLKSFPAASPLLFQSSIHPGSVQQVLIGRQQPVARLWPLAGRDRLVEQALLTALLEPAARVALIGGEERGTWMGESGYASARSFAFATLLTRAEAGAQAGLTFTPGPAADEACPTLETFTTTLATRSPLRWSGAGGDWSLTLAMNAPAQPPRNPGPSWGFGFLLRAERWTPGWLFRPALMAGTWVGVATMPAQRTHSRAYLAVVLGRPATLVEVWRHFFAFAEIMMLKLRAGRGVAVPCELAPENAVAFEALVASPRPALFGTFHFGASDLLGYLLGARGRRVSIIRLQVGNAADTRLLGRQFEGQVSVLWVNDPTRLLFDLKAALEAGESLALNADRVEFSARTEPFHFLGASRLFPFTIYHLAVLFDRPVVFCTAVPAGPDGLRVFASPVFTPDPAAGRTVNMAAARQHFQGVLIRLEELVRAHPFLWFNFRPLNPVAPAAIP